MGRFLLAASALACMLPLSASAQLASEIPDAAVLGDIAPVSAPPVSVMPTPAPTASPVPISVVNAQVGTRLALRAQNPAEGRRNDVDDVGSDGEAQVELWGSLHPFLKWQAGVVGRYGDPSDSSSAELLDLVGKIELAGSFNVWIGRMPMPSDRTSLSTEWSIASWGMPGVYTFYGTMPVGAPSVPIGPRYGKSHRGDGATVWGQLRGGTFKYYLGVFGLAEPTTSPLYTGRLSLSLLNPEPGFRNASTYYGTKDVLSIGVGAQHRTQGSLVRAPLGQALASSDFNAVTGDLLFEKNGGAAGVVDIEGGFTKLWGDGELASYQAFGLISYLVPLDVGIGRFQPLFRVQYAGKSSAVDAHDFTGAEAQLGYIIDGLNARLLGSYLYSKLGGQTENAIVLGLQLLSHAR